MASPPHQQLLHHHSTEVSCDSSGDSNSVRVKINPKQLSSNSQPKHCKYSISSSCSSSGDSGGLPRRVGGGGRLRRQRKLPQLFERASSRWWDPKFDSVNLEEACLERCFPQTQRRFRYALFYIGFACLLWSIYFAVHMRAKLIVMVAPALCFLAVCVGFFLFTFTKLYARHYAWTSLVLTLLVFTLTLAAQFQVLTPLSGRVDSSNHTAAAKSTDTCLSQVGSFSMCIEVLFLLYTVMHLPLYLSLFLGVAYSVLFETFGYHFRDEDCFPWPGARALHWELLGRALLHVCIHAIGVHLFIMSQVRSRSTFLKVGQSIMHGKDLEVEKALKERMIHSVMPRIIADDLMRQGDEESENSVKRHATSSPKNRKKKSSIQKTPIAFRPFKMQQIEEVSILFADIVGFTKMSANKSAHALVGLLNDLFGRFDRLCEETKCEKISTLGDCYYCVAGCPEPRADHAYCCIEMGLGMIKAIEQFCQEKKEMVNMRVGVHTGTVLCGILGMRRFKFDVWSNDVNLANLMEQLGVAGKVHISEATAKYLDDRYEMEDGKVIERLGQSVVADQLKGLKTYLISGQRAKESHCSCAEALLSGFEAIGSSRVSSGPRGQGTASSGSVSDLAQTVQTFDNLKTCPSCGITFAPKAEASAEGGAVQNGCPDERANSTKVTSSWLLFLSVPLLAHPPKASGGSNAKTQNGLLSPPQEEKLTSSQTSLCEILQEKGRWAGVSLDQSALLPLRFKNIREKTDAHFVDVIKEDSLMKDYFFKPPINQFSLNFLDQELERSYRTSYQEEVVKNSPVKTFASATFSSLLDVFLSTTVFLILSVTCFLKYGATATPPPPAALAVFGAALLLELLSLAVSIRMVFFLEDVMACTKRLLEWVAGWLPRHCIGAVLVSLPALAVYSHVTSEFERNVHFHSNVSPRCSTEFQLREESMRQLVAAGRRKTSHPHRPGADLGLLPAALAGLVPEPRVRGQLPPSLPRGRGGGPAPHQDPEHEGPGRLAAQEHHPLPRGRAAEGVTDLLQEPRQRRRDLCQHRQLQRVLRGELRGRQGVLPRPQRADRGLRRAPEQAGLQQHREDQDHRGHLHGGVGAEHGAAPGWQPPAGAPAGPVRVRQGDDARGGRLQQQHAVVQLQAQSGLPPRAPHGGRHRHHQAAVRHLGGHGQHRQQDGHHRRRVPHPGERGELPRLEQDGL
ncbi:adenylate cyclase type 9 isoform X3 [Tupaia chinensis]|uniref:adenylate cyclase type 9 isoform X3 n=1 Tax=Tupaia chinensis TaxID=246437 RepID=UPI000FFBBF31|nr:adenylate cyclase type 9 isoform X3 [Tupaia chinensis]